MNTKFRKQTPPDALHLRQGELAVEAHIEHRPQTGLKLLGLRGLGHLVFANVGKPGTVELVARNICQDYAVAVREGQAPLVWRSCRIRELGVPSQHFNYRV
jgi:hypothetical protein